MRLTRKTLRKMILKEFKDTYGSFTGYGGVPENVQFMMEYLADRHRENSRFSAWNEVLFTDRAANQGTGVQVEPDYWVNRNTTQLWASVLAPMINGEVEPGVDLLNLKNRMTQDDLDRTAGVYSLAIQNGLTNLNNRFPMAFQNTVNEIKRLQSLGFD